MSLKEKLLEDSSDIFLNNSEFAEEITYISSTSKAILIDAVVVRLGLEPGAKMLADPLEIRQRFMLPMMGFQELSNLTKKMIE